LKLGDAGRLNVDRRLPFLCLQRGAVDVGDPSLVTSEAAWLHAPPGRSADATIRALVEVIGAIAQERFGAFLLLEVVVADRLPGEGSPRLRILAGRDEVSDDIAETLARFLRRLRPWGAEAEVGHWKSRAKKGEPRPLLGAAAAAALSCVQVTIEVPRVWRSDEGDQAYPRVLRRVRREVGLAMRQAAYRFALNHTTHRPPDFHALGRRATVKAVWDVDRQLSAINAQFDLLLCVTPINGDAAWNAFRRGGFEKAPRLRYRPLPVEPALLKRDLFRIPIERVEDPTLGDLFYEKQAEIDRQLTLLSDRGTQRFRFGSLAAYGPCTVELLREAEGILENVSATARGRGGGATIGAVEFAERADREVAWYREQWAGFEGEVEVRRDTSGGLMVSHGRLLIPSGLQAPAGRVDALLQHEVGTHMVTWWNGRSQRLQQLAHGLAGYEGLQEGLAVLAEYVVGGMTPARLRTLAGRVIIANAVAQGATFVDSFRLLRRYGFGQQAAFGLVVRIYRGGGFTKDLIYLRGLLTVMEHLRGGGDLEPLYVGKIAARHVPMIRELQSRRLLTPPRVLPRYLQRDDLQERLEPVRTGLKPYQLLRG
jgi:uncharacterized protein (TIGR02421 family)